MPKIIAAGVGLPLIGTGATVTTSQPLLNLTQTWNNGAVTFTGLKFNVTDTASASGSLLMDLQVGGSGKFNVDKVGSVFSQGTLYAQGGSIRVLNNAGVLSLGTNNDVVLRRDAANTLALRNGTAAQAFNVYNTYTDASNYERGVFDWAGTANTLRIGTEAAGTGTVRNIQLVAGSNSVTLTVGALGLATFSGTLASANSVWAGINSGVFIQGRSGFSSGADGTFRIQNNAGTLTTNITLSEASGTGTSTATFGGSIVSGGNVQAVSAGGFSWLGGKGGITQVTDGAFTFSNNAGSNSVNLTVGASNLLTLNGGLKTTGATFALQTATTLTDNAAAQVATMTNGPAAGNPTKWIAINDNGVTRYIPAW